MRLFSIPIELEGEERTFGGVATIRQVLYIITAIAVAVSLFIFLRMLGLNTVINVFLCLPIFMVGICFAFVSIEDIQLDKYLLYLGRFYLRPKTFYMKGDD